MYNLIYLLQMFQMQLYQFWVDKLQHITSSQHNALVSIEKSKFDEDRVRQVLSDEIALGYYFETGKYWDYLSEICNQSVHEIDQLWLSFYDRATKT